MHAEYLGAMSATSKFGDNRTFAGLCGNPQSHVCVTGIACFHSYGHPRRGTPLHALGTLLPIWRHPLDMPFLDGY